MLRKTTLVKLFRASFLALSTLAIVGCDDAVGSSAALATDQRGVSSMAVDGTYVYWTTQSGAVRRVSIDGGEVETLVDNLTNPDHVTVDGTHVYLSVQAALGRVPKEGGALEVLSTVTSVTGVQVDDHRVFWSEQTGEVKAVAKGEATAEVIAADAGPLGSLSREGNRLFWAVNPTSSTTDEGAVHAVDTDGGEVSEVARAAGLRALATARSRMAWVALDAEALAVDPTSNLLALTSAAIGGGDERVLARDLSGVDSLVIDEAQVFFSTLGGDVAVASFAGGKPETFSSGLAGKTSLAVDATSVYWARREGTAVFVRPKPTQTAFE